MRTELRRRGAILEAVRVAAERFLDPSRHWTDDIAGVLEGLARATGVSRVYLFEHQRVDVDEVWTSQRFEWCADDVESQLDNPNMIDLPLVAMGWRRWVDLLADGEPVLGRVRDFPPGERPELERQDILSLALVPIVVDGAWWGFIGFDDCRSERVWSTGEVDALRAAASTIAAAIRADRMQGELRAREAQYRAVFRAVGDGLVITGLDTRVVEANPAFHAMHGYEPGEMTGMPTRDWLAVEHGDLPRQFAEQGRLRTAAVDRRRDGTTFPAEITANAFEFRGQPHVLGVVRDMTERMRSRQLLIDRVDALARGAASLTVDAPQHVTMDHIARLAVETSAAVACSVETADPSTGRATVRGTHGVSDDYLEALRQVWNRGVESPTTVALHEQRTVFLRNVRDVGLARADYAPLHHELEQVAWRHVLVVPLDAAGRTLGALNVCYGDGDEPTDEERLFLQALADLASAAIANGELFAATEGTAKLQERQRLARELHDSVSQALYGIALGARTARTLADDDPTRVLEPLEYVLSLAEAGLSEMRALIFELRPESLATEGLVAALERQARAVRARHGIEVDYASGPEPDLTFEAKEALYRIAQEAMHNVVKHAGATRIRLELATSPDEVRLTVRDDGQGFDSTGSFPGHMGLVSMRERAEAVGGNLTIDSVGGAGTAVSAGVPAGSSAPRR